MTVVIEIRLLQMPALEHTYKVMYIGHEVGYVRYSHENDYWGMWVGGLPDEGGGKLKAREDRRESAALRLAKYWLDRQPKGR